MLTRLILQSEAPVDFIMGGERTTTGCCSHKWAPIVRGCMIDKRKEAARCYVDIRTHAARLYCLSAELVKCEALFTHKNKEWNQVVHHLFMVQSISKVFQNSGFHAGDDYAPCSAGYAYDAMVDVISENYITASIRFGFIFTALEGLVKARNRHHAVSTRDARQDAAGARKSAESRSFNQLGEDLDESFPMTASMRLACDAAKAACLVIGDLDNDLEEISKLKSGLPINQESFTYCLKLLKKFRNNYVHGHEELTMPSNDDVQTRRTDASNIALVDRHNAMSRIALILMQFCLVKELNSETCIKVGRYEDASTDVHEVVISARSALKTLHFHDYGLRKRIFMPEGPWVESISKPRGS